MHYDKINLPMSALGQKHALPRRSIAVRFTSINGHQREWCFGSPPTGAAPTLPSDHTSSEMR